MTTADHVLAILLVLVSPLLSGTLGMRRLRVVAPGGEAAARAATYRTVVLTQWARAAAAVWIWNWARRPLADLGLTFRANTGTLGAALGLAIIVVVMLRQRAQALADVEGREEIRERLEPTRPLLPHARDEFARFAVVAITAGICEEILYRGYVTWYFAHIMPWWAAMLASAAAFGFGHAYQGMRGVLVTALLGLFLGAVYWLTGSLVLPILVHALMDLHSGDLAWRVYEAEADDFRAPFDGDDRGPVDAA
jgi:membrane protease YdiL (CAAX protease family)